jgi:hypothetical protein
VRAGSITLRYFTTEKEDTAQGSGRQADREEKQV